MENLTYAELVSILGEDAAQEIMQQREAAQGKGGKLPFTMLKKVSDVMGNELGQFGEFVYGAEKSTDDSGESTYTSVGVNLGKDFEFVMVTSAFYYKKYVEGAGKNGKGRTFKSNMFKSLSGIETAVDHNGNALPKSKEAKKAAGWKLVRMNAGLVRKSSKDAWAPVIWEVDGTMLYGFNNIIEPDSNKGLLSKVLKVSATHKKSGATVFVVIDEAKSGLGELPKDFFKNESATIKTIIEDMKAYVDSNIPAVPNSAPQVANDSMDENW